MYSVLINIDGAAMLVGMLEETPRVTKEGIVFHRSASDADHLDFFVHQPLTTVQRMKRFAKEILGQISHPTQIQYLAYRPAQFLKYCNKFDVQKFFLLSESILRRIDIVYDRVRINGELDAVRL